MNCVRKLAFIIKTAANKLSLTLETNHGPITLAGELKQGKLSGKFNSGPMQGTWQAGRK